jgi:hypothetical protein
VTYTWDPTTRLILEWAAAEMMHGSTWYYDKYGMRHDDKEPEHNAHIISTVEHMYRKHKAGNPNG